MPGLKTSAVAGDKKAFSLFVPLSKIDPDQRMVYGYASTDATDMEGEIISIEALTAALPGYMKFANLREMHQLSAIGVTKTAEMDEKGLYIGGKIVDDAAWAKVKAGVYKGFSIGGTVTMRDPNNDKIITGLDLIEISAVDRPANPDCLIDMWKAVRDGGVRRPIQKWDCGVVGHDHEKKDDAVKCIEGQTDKTAAMRSKLIKAVDALDDAGLEAAVNALEKAGAKDKDKTDKDADEPAPKAGDSPVPLPDKPQPVSSKAGTLHDGDEEKTPKVGDLIAFANDKHTDKGPSSGTIAAVEDGKVMIDHSDVKADEFDWSKLGDPELKVNDAGQRIWLIKCEAEDVTGQPDACLITIPYGDSKKTFTAAWVKRTDNPYAGDDKTRKADAKDDEGDDKKDDAADDSKDKPDGDYGSQADAAYADPGYQEDKKPRYPLKDGGSYSEKRIRAAWNYINKPKNAGLYSADQVKEIKDKIIAAWKETIDKDGPPSAEDDGDKKAAANQPENPKMNRELISKLGAPDAKAGIKKGLVAAASAIYCLDGLKELHDRLAREAAVEGDGSTAPDRMMAVITMLAEVVQAILEEEIEEMLANKEIGDMAFSPYGPDCFYYAKPATDIAKRAKPANERMRDAFLKAIGDKTGEPNFENLTKAVEAIFAKGQDEWTGSKPADQQGNGDGWGGASKPADEQGSGDKWPAEMKEAAQKTHDLSLTMGASCDGVHKAKKDKADDGKDGDGKKNPPPPAKGDAEDQADGGKDEQSEGDGKGDSKADKKKDKADDGKDGDADKGKKAADGDIAKVGEAPLTKAEGVAIIDTVVAMKGMIEDMADRIGSSRNPPPPGGSRQRVDKTQDGPVSLQQDGTTKVITPQNATDEDRAAVLRSVMASPKFVNR